MLWSRLPRAERLRGGETWRAGGDAGRSRAAAGHERVSVVSAGTRVRAHAAATHGDGTGMCMSVMCHVCLCRSRVSYFAVFDGHGGARASRFAAENLHHNLAKKFPSGEFI